MQKSSFDFVSPSKCARHFLEKNIIRSEVQNEIFLYVNAINPSMFSTVKMLKFKIFVE